eukprot:3106392-Alexandrium_andersonii.AAC.1
MGSAVRRGCLRPRAAAHCGAHRPGSGSRLLSGHHHGHVGGGQVRARGPPRRHAPRGSGGAQRWLRTG